MEGQLLTNIRFQVHDPEDLFVDGHQLSGDLLYRSLSNINMNWISYPEDLNSVIFLYPVSINITDTGIGEYFSSYVKTAKYAISDLPTALEVIGAIGTYYKRLLVEPEIPDVFGQSSHFSNSEFNLSLKMYNSDLVYYKVFSGLIIIKLGVYLVKLEDV